MSDDDYPSRHLDRVMVRLPDGMRNRLKDAAADNGRSMNAEIVFRLEAYDGHAEDRNVLLNKIAQLERTNAVMRERLTLIDGDLEGKAFRLDYEHRETGRRMEKFEKTLNRLLHEISELRSRTEFIQAQPERVGPEQLARRAAIRDGYAEGVPTYANPYPEHTREWREYRMTFRNVLVRRFKSEELQAMPEIEHLFRRSDGTPHGPAYDFKGPSAPSSD